MPPDLARIASVDPGEGAEQVDSKTLMVRIL